MADLPGWPYWKVASITGQAGSGTDYQVELEIGDSAGGDFHLEGHCTNFPQDIRITDDDGTTLLDHWVEDLTADPIKVWVEVKDDLGSNRDIRVYYGKSGETTVSNISNTMLKGDDFGGDLSAWTDNSSAEATVQIESGELSLDSGIDERYVKMSITTPTFSMPFIVEFDEYEVGYYTDVTNWMGIQVCMASTSAWLNDNGHGFILNHQGNYILLEDGSEIGGWTASGVTPTTKHLVKFTVKNGNLIVDIDGNNIVNWSGTTTATSGYVGVRGWGFHHHIDNFRIRKYNSPEPAFSSAGAEQSPTGAAPTGVFYGPLMGPFGGPI